MLELVVDWGILAKLCGWSRCLGVASSDWVLVDSCALGWFGLWLVVVVFGILLSFPGAVVKLLLRVLMLGCCCMHPSFLLVA